MSATSSQFGENDAVLKTQFQQPESCPVSVCSAIAMYEEELARHRETEASLRESVLRENDLLRQKDELILQKDILRKESEHRFLNGLQLITSLLALQSRATKSAEVAAQLTTAANRVARLGHIHRHLHTLDSANSVEFKEFVAKLCVDLADMASSDRSDRSLIVEGPELQIPTAIAAPLGFIVCELLTNSIKYAKGRIVVRLQATPQGSSLSISDEGPGLPHGFDPAASSGLGMKLIKALVSQIGGTFDTGTGDCGQGTKFTVSFASQDSAPAHPARATIP